MSLVDWGRRYLPRHFKLALGMHLWLDDRCAAPTSVRGQRLNVIGRAAPQVDPRHARLHIARGGRRFGALHLDRFDTRRQACGNLENPQARARRQSPAPRRTTLSSPGVAHSGKTAPSSSPAACGSKPTNRPAHPRPTARRDRPTLIISTTCKTIRTWNRPGSANIRSSVRGNAPQSRLQDHQRRHLATALHRDALAPRLHRTPVTCAIFSAIVHWPERWNCARVGRLYSNADDPDRELSAARFTTSTPRSFTPAPSFSARGGRPLHADADARHQRPAPRSARKAGLAVNPDACEWPEEYFEEPAVVRRLARGAASQDHSPSSEQRRRAHARRFFGLRAAGVAAMASYILTQTSARRADAADRHDGVELYRRFAPDALAVESNQFQELLADEFAAEFARQGLVGAQPWTLENHVNKRVRIRRLGRSSPAADALFARSPRRKLLVRATADFPNGDHDDGPTPWKCDPPGRRTSSAANIPAAAATGPGERLPLSS